MVTNKLIDFTRNDNKVLFKQYLSLKFEIFVEEMGWTVLPYSAIQRACFEDVFDHNSKFSSVVNAKSEMLGVIRGSMPYRTADLYRRKLYLDFLKADCLNSIDGRIATINSLAVKKEYRYSNISENQHRIQQTTPISDALMDRMIDILQNSGAALIILSAIDGGAQSVMKRVGFQVINQPHYFYGKDYSSNSQARTLKIMDMALAVELDSEIQEYLNNREALVLRS